MAGVGRWAVRVDRPGPDVAVVLRPSEPGRIDYVDDDVVGSGQTEKLPGIPAFVVAVAEDQSVCLAHEDNRAARTGKTAERAYGVHQRLHRPPVVVEVLAEDSTLACRTEPLAIRCEVLGRRLGPCEHDGATVARRHAFLDELRDGIAQPRRP